MTHPMCQKFCFILSFLIVQSRSQLSSDLNQELPYRAADGISSTSQDQFLSAIANILRSISLGWEETVAYPQMVQSFLISSPMFPSSSDFEKFIGSNMDYDPRGVIKFTEWVPRVPKSERSQFEQKMRMVDPGFEIFLFASDGITDIVEPQNSSSEYHPISYCSPRYDPLVGFDLYNDKVEGPFLREARDSGAPTSPPPFLLRGIVERFKMGTTVYLPLYAINSSHFNSTSPVVDLSLKRSSIYWGCVVAVINFSSFMNSILQDLDLQNLDVFLFNAADSSYVAHYESDPAQTKPNYSPENASSLVPANISGDLVTAYSSEYDVVIAGRTYRLLIRSRAGTNERDVQVYSRRAAMTVLSPCSFSTAS